MGLHNENWYYLVDSLSISQHLSTLMQFVVRGSSLNIEPPTSSEQEEQVIRELDRALNEWIDNAPDHCAFCASPSSCYLTLLDLSTLESPHVQG